MALNLDQYKTFQRFQEGDYLGMLRSLLPQGPIWGFDRGLDTEILQDIKDTSATTMQDSTTAPDVIQDTILDSTGIAGSLFGRLLSCFANELSRFSRRFWTLVREAIPGLSEELLPDHEKQLGLPDSCSSVAMTTTQRQCAAHAKQYEEYKTTTNQFFIDYASTLGFTITIDEGALVGQPRIMGSSKMGSTQPRMGSKRSYAILEITVTAGDGSLDGLKCTFRRIKQAHMIFVYVDARTP